MIVSAFRVLRGAVQDFFRNFWLSLATVSVLTLTLLTVNGLIAVNFLAQSAISEVREKVDIGVHFRPDVSEERVQTVRITLMGMPEVRDVEFVSPAESLERFSDQYGKDPLILESLSGVGANPFGSVLVVRARSLDGYERILKVLEDPLFAGLIEDRDFDDRQEMIDRIELIAGRIEAFGLGVSLAIALITLLIVVNTVRVSIYTHRDEIRIMRLVGASDSFIRGPFYLQSVFWSLLSVALAALVVIPSSVFLQPYLHDFFGSSSVDLAGFYGSNFLRIFGPQFLAILLMSWIAAKAATAKYLKN